MEIEEKLAVYIQEINHRPLLDTTEEQSLSKTIQGRLEVHSAIEDEDKRRASENNDEVLGKAIDTFVSHNLRLVIKEAFKFNRATGVNLKDLIGSGNLGLLKAVYLYDYSKYKTKFSTYATYWIRNAMFETVHSGGVVKIPVHILNGRYRHNKLLENGEVSDETIMKAMSIDEDQLKRIRDANVSVISLDQEVRWKTEQNITTVGDLIPDENAIDPSESAGSKDQYQYLYDAMEELDEESRDIISAQILADDKVQLRALGEKYGKTGERIRQIREKALKTLRKKIEIRTKQAERERG